MAEQNAPKKPRAKPKPKVEKMYTQAEVQAFYVAARRAEVAAAEEAKRAEEERKNLEVSKLNNDVYEAQVNLDKAIQARIDAVEEVEDRRRALESANLALAKYSQPDQQPSVSENVIQTLTSRKFWKEVFGLK